jgi:ABC-type multidrug transport system fused ATPase/permease subunit
VPPTLFRFVFLFGKWHQAGIAVLSVVLFVFGTAPLEIQRRIVNAATSGTSYTQIVVLVLIYVALGLGEGAMKIGFNLYTSWIGEFAIRWIRLVVLGSAPPPQVHANMPAAENVQLSIVLAEAEPVGGFVGECISQPLLQSGILAAVGGYMVYLQPLMALVVAGVFLPQVALVPFMQAAINRRVEARIAVARDVSQGILDPSIDGDINSQVKRISFLFSTNMTIYRVKFLMNFLMNFMTHLGYAAIFALGGYYVVTGKTEIGTVVVFISGLSKINDPWGQLVDWYRNLKVTQIKYQLIRDACSDGEDDAQTLVATVARHWL